MAKKFLIVSLIGVFLLFGGLFAYGVINLQPLNPAGQTDSLEFTVDKGESLFSVLQRLEEQSLIRNAGVVKFYVRFISPAVIKNGTYNLNAAMAPREILAALVQGRQELVKVTIPEGLTATQTAEILYGKGIIGSQEDFLALLSSREFIDSLGIEAENLQGYLYPDTYFLQKDFPQEKVIAHMVETFFDTLESIYPYFRDFSAEKMAEKLILASIVEKEYRVQEEASRIASVFYNRLNIGMPLQSCATVVYVMTEELGKEHPERIFERDLKIESPYNTYITQTLPPGPIANPGRVALDAAFNPAQTDYLFFVVRNAAEGTHTFTNNLTDHNIARQSYLSGFRSK